MAVDHLFVYGTLLPGRKNGALLAPLNGVWQFAKVRGKLVDEGWGASLGYPAFRPDPDGDVIEGVVLSSPDLKTKWEDLDAFEGPGYERVNVDVELADDQKLTAQIYAIAG